MQNKVWTFDKAQVEFYLENASGCVIDTNTSDVISDFDPVSPQTDPLFSYCYLDGATLTGQHTQTRRKVTGRVVPKITNSHWEYGMSIDALFFDKSEELRVNDVLSRNQFLRIVWREVDAATNVVPAVMVLSRATATDFNLTGKDDNVITFKAGFTAEEFDVY